jgi:hypothetical protein
MNRAPENSDTFEKLIGQALDNSAATEWEISKASFDDLTHKTDVVKKSLFVEL